MSAAQVPQTLIQIHYHDNPCGVNKVIRFYAKAFRHIHGNAAARNIVVCAPIKKNAVNFSPAKMIPQPLCAYRTFGSLYSFEKTTARLTNFLTKLFTGAAVEFPLCVVGHNLTLGKNCALTAAFSRVARRCANEPDSIQFMSVIHDFAEEGRTDCIEKIENVKQWGIADHEVFPQGKNIRIVTLNANNAGILANAGFLCNILFNPVEKINPAPPAVPTPAIAEKGGRGNQSLLCLRKKTFPRLIDSLPTVLYPSRCISRKNMLEAILVCNSVCAANLLLGGPGTDPGDRLLFKNAAALARHRKLPVVFNFGNIGADPSNASGFTDRGFDFCDSVISTAVAEGFGYGLFEPWLHDKAVFGRKYLGFTPIARMKFDFLYDELPIPAQWISVRDMRDTYWSAMNACFGSIKKSSILSGRKNFDRAFTEYFVRDNAVDFGCLDIPTQFRILHCVLKKPAKIDEWEKSCGRKLMDVKRAFYESLYAGKKALSYNKACLRRHLSLPVFSRQLKKAIAPGNIPCAHRGDREKLLGEFCRFSRFRLLMRKAAIR